MLVVFQEIVCFTTIAHSRAPLAIFLAFRVPLTKKLILTIGHYVSWYVYLRKCQYFLRKMFSFSAVAHFRIFLPIFLAIRVLVTKKLILTPRNYIFWCLDNENVDVFTKMVSFSSTVHS